LPSADGAFNKTMDLAKNKTVIILVGATATGKTATAIDLAKHFEQSISADRQCLKN
jgi:flagellar biosynthesis GTPase FlhF